MTTKFDPQGYGNRDGYIWFNGELIAWRSAQIHILSHALHYGSSVFEGERSYGGKIFANREHTLRLLESARQIDIDINYTPEEIEQAKAETLRINGLSDAYIRPVAWRADGPEMGISSTKNPCNLAIATWEWGRYYGSNDNTDEIKGIKLDISDWQRPSEKMIPCHTKASGLYMICTISKHKAQMRGFSDALMFDYRGYIAEATGANIFFVRDGEVHTPKPDCFLNGITRQKVLELLKHRGIKIHERHIEPSEMESFEQCWLTGTAAEVEPVSQIRDYNFVVGKLAKTMVSDYNVLVRS